MEIINVAVCDDDAAFREMLVCEISGWADYRGVRSNIHSFSSGLELMISEVPYNVIFLDYKMGIMNGLETAKKLRGKGLDCPIIFVSSYNEVVYDVFEVSAFRFINKPVEQEVLRKALDDVVELYRSRRTISISRNDGVVNILTDDIIYIESKLRGCVIHTVSGMENFRQSLAALEKMLPNGIFCHCSMGCILNMKFIAKITAKSAVLTNGETIKCGMTRIAALNDALTAYNDKYSKIK